MSNQYRFSTNFDVVRTSFNSFHIVPFQPSPNQETNKKILDIDKSAKLKASLPSTTPATTIDRNQPNLSAKPTSAQTALNRSKHTSNSDTDKKSPATTELITSDKVTNKIIGNMSSNAAGQTAKTGNKVAIDHQATLDKGLKMKIKRTKPGTKTSEAKHEIVKAEQNGLLSGADDSNSSSSGSNNGNKKLTMQQQNQQSAAGQQQAATASAPLQANSSSQQLSPNST